MNIKTKIGALVVTAAALSACGVGGSTTVTKSCMGSSRSPGGSACSCAQQVANQYLSGSDQAKLAKMVNEPDLYLRYKERDRGFINRLSNYAEAAEAYCG